MSRIGVAKRLWLWWSSGKDSAWTLHELRSEPDIEVAALVVTLNQAFDRVTMHGVRRHLVERQAEAAGLPVVWMEVPHPCSNERYEQEFHRVVADAETGGVEAMAFGDLFLEDVRSYREGLFEDRSIRPLFPLWGRDTGKLAWTMVEAGLEAYVSCVDPQALPRSFVQRVFDETFLRELPESVDPCGERGEFHTFAHAGPMFASVVDVRPGEVVERDGFVFRDLL